MAAYEAENVVVCYSFIRSQRRIEQGFFLQEKMIARMEVSREIF